MWQLNKHRDLVKFETRNVFFVLLLPFLINDFVFLYVDGSYNLYLLDYLFRIVVLAVCFGWPLSRGFALEIPVFPALPFKNIVLWTILLVWICWLLRFFLWPVLDANFNWTQLFGFSRIHDTYLRWFDLTIGLLLVALSEELVFRKLALKWLKTITSDQNKIVVISAAIFGLAHWGLGIGHVINSFITGLLFMAFYMKVRSLLPLVFAHWITNFMVFY